MKPLVGSVILLGAVAGAVLLAVRLTSRRDPITGRNSWSRLSRAGVIVGVVLGTPLAITPILRATGTDPEGESASEQLRDELSDGGFSEAEVACVEDRLAGDYSSVDEAMDAVEDDTEILLRPIMRCKQGVGLTDDYIDCFADALANRYEMDDMSAEELTAVVGSFRPEDRQALATAALVCQGTPPDVADCVIDEMAEQYPGMFEAERMEALTAAQQQFMFDTAAKCAER